jgi:hypothetical protein
MPTAEAAAVDRHRPPARRQVAEQLLLPRHAYADASGRNHWFLLQRGRYTTIDAPGRQANATAWGSTSAARSSASPATPGTKPTTTDPPPMGRMA